MIPTKSISIVRPLALFVILAASMSVTACLKVDVTFDEKGGGTMTLAVSDLDSAGHERIVKQLVSPAVKLTSSAYKDKVGTYVLAFEDAKKLRTAPLLSQLRVQHSGLDGSHRTVSMTLPRREKGPVDKPEKVQQHITIDLTVAVPGKVAETNGTAVSESSSNWKIRVKDMFGTGRIGARTVYDLASADKPAADTDQPAARPASDDSAKAKAAAAGD